MGVDRHARLGAPDMNLAAFHQGAGTDYALFGGRGSFHARTGGRSHPWSPPRTFESRRPRTRWEKSICAGPMLTQCTFGRASRGIDSHLGCEAPNPSRLRRGSAFHPGPAPSARPWHNSAAYQVASQPLEPAAAVGEPCALYEAASSRQRRQLLPLRGTIHGSSGFG